MGARVVQKGEGEGAAMRQMHCGSRDWDGRNAECRERKKKKQKPKNE